MQLTLRETRDHQPFWSPSSWPRANYPKQAKEIGRIMQQLDAATKGTPSEQLVLVGQLEKLLKNLKQALPKEGLKALNNEFQALEDYIKVPE